MKVHYLQHVPFEGLAYIEYWLKENKHEISVTRFYEAGYHLPSVEGIDALIVLGGPMGVYDEHAYAWLHQEKAFIRDCIHAGKKVLGICLGGQLIAVCLGAIVHRAPYQEIGWFPVSPTEESAGLPWFYQLFANNPMVFHWHGDQFEIPGNGCLNLLTSAANSNQAFCYNDNVMGLQFHLEITEQAIVQMLQNGAAELIDAPYIQTAEEISHRIAHTEECNKLMEAILRHWLG
jgi:GMP synthase-like glutamine amidotransferase